ncbi:hypothetical protein L195_g047122 [Trifolium pratense]|uniref:Uncharacterized protein n=1 Tax=Trifolium pratense TaxID=57577 RepID=A0A2K3MJM5_TRIPR|nr:hypothetical protein L195_g047122 [Trifolium pratense]
MIEAAGSKINEIDLKNRNNRSLRFRVTGVRGAWRRRNWAEIVAGSDGGGGGEQ